MKRDIVQDIADYIHDQFTKHGRDRMRFNEIAARFAKRLPTYKDKCPYCGQQCAVKAGQQIADAWHKIEKHLINMGLVVVPVTEEYFNLFNRFEPRNRQERRISIAVHWRPCEGIRLFTANGLKDDPLGVMWLELKRKNPTGMRKWDAVRSLTEYREGHLTRKKGQKLLTMILNGVELPSDMELELKKLFNK